MHGDISLNEYHAVPPDEHHRSNSGAAGANQQYLHVDTPEDTPATSYDPRVATAGPARSRSVSPARSEESDYNPAEQYGAVTNATTTAYQPVVAADGDNYPDTVPIMTYNYGSNASDLATNGDAGKEAAKEDFFIRERPKIVLKTAFPLFELSIHMITVAVTLLIIALNFREVYWSDIDHDFPGPWSQSTMLKAWQFAAKAHELILLASVSCIALGVMHLILFRGGVPFGLLDAGYQVGNAAGILLHARFWRSLRRSWFGLLVLLCAFLSLVLGPSSAIAMIPELDWWSLSSPYAGNNLTSFFRRNQSEIWPMQIDAFDQNFANMSKCSTDNAMVYTDCPGNGFSVIRNWVSGYAYAGTTANFSMNEAWSNSQRLLTSQAQTGPPYNSSRSITTTGMGLTTMSLGLFWHYLQNVAIGTASQTMKPRFKSVLKAGTSLYQPLVCVECTAVVLEDMKQWKNTSRISYRTPTTPWRTDDFDWFSLRPNASVLQNLPTTWNRFEWMKIPGDSRSIGSVSVVPLGFYNETLPHGIQSNIIVPCTIDARWAAVEVSLEPKSSSLITTNLTDLTPFLNSSAEVTERTALKQKYGISDRIDISMEWAELLTWRFTAYSGKPGKSTMDNLFDMLTLNTSDFQRQFFPPSKQNAPANAFKVNDDFNQYLRDVEEAIATIIGVFVSDGMARSGYMAPLSLPYIMDPRNDSSRNLVDLARFNSTIFRYSWQEFLDSANKTADELMSVSYTVQRYGYSYSTSGLAIRLGLTVLFAYLILVFVYLGVSTVAIIRGTYASSSAWGEIGSMIALAVNSSPSVFLTGTGAGIGHPKTWLLNTRVREVDEGRLQLVISRQDEGHILGRSVSIGKKYV
jgi:hypothetical protein